jgi:ATP-dependent Clp protease protease subunit
MPGRWPRLPDGLGHPAVRSAVVLDSLSAYGVRPAARYGTGVAAIHLRREPFPYRPDPWHVPSGQPAGPGHGERLSAWLDERLFDRRIVVLRGPLDGSTASQVAAALLTLDTMGTETVQLHMSAHDGELAAAFAIVDAMDTLRAPVHAVVTSEVGGAAVAILAAAKRRLAFRHARIRLAEPRVATVAGTADEVTAAAGQYLRELEEMALRLVDVTGQPRSRIEDDLNAGRVLTAEQAREYGLIDEILGPADKPTAA